MSMVVICSVAMISTSCKNVNVKEDADGGFSLNTAKIDIPGVVGPTLFVSENEFTISIVFENREMAGGFRYAVPKYPNSYVELGPSLSTSGTLLNIRLSIEDLSDESGVIQSLPPQYLPGGRPVPGIPSGRLPAVAFSVEKLKGLSLYMGARFFGIFIPYTYKTGIVSQGNIITSKFYSKAARNATISLVGEDQNNENSGILLLLDLNSTSAPTAPAEDTPTEVPPPTASAPIEITDRA